MTLFSERKQNNDDCNDEISFLQSALPPSGERVHILAFHLENLRLG